MKRAFLLPQSISVGLLSLVLWLAGAGLALAEEAVDAAPRLEKPLAERAQARWNALIVGELADAYAFETPGYRATVTPAQFRSRFGAMVRWRGATVAATEVSKTGDHAQVKVMVDYQGPDPMGQLYTGRRPLFERWILSEGEWWHVQD